jgi:hypothetical protein
MRYSKQRGAVSKTTIAGAAVVTTNLVIIEYIVLYSFRIKLEEKGTRTLLKISLSTVNAN